MRLIDADELRKKAQWMEMPDRQGINFDVRAVSASSIDLSPTIDAVPVVRCKDCKHRKLSGAAPFMYYCCNNNDGLVGGLRENDFCSYGERKEVTASEHF